MKHQLELIGLMLITVFAPIQAVLGTTMLLIGVDFVSGVIAAKKRKEKITSAGFRRSLSKLVIYEIALMIGFLAQTYMIPIMPIVNMVSSLIALTECRSIFENLDNINGGNLLKTIIDKLGSANSTPSE